MQRDHWLALTTIAAPTVAVQEFAAIAAEREWGFAIAGDTKTPDITSVGIDYLSIARQHADFGDYSRATPVRHYARKNFAYLHAIREGARIIVESDDDNRPYDTFAVGLEDQVQGRILRGDRWANVYRYFTDHEMIWPRGLPLDRIHDKGELGGIERQTCSIRQYLADSDPDVDAVYRLLYRTPLYFGRDAETVLLAPGTYCPFNSQNTVIYEDAFELLYLPAHVSFRMTDIWRSFVAQRILWSQGKTVSFHAPTVYQERNAHNLMRDFADEVVGYLRNDEIATALDEVRLDGLSTGDAMVACYDRLREIEIIRPEELDLVQGWLKAVAAARG